MHVWHREHLDERYEATRLSDDPTDLAIPREVPERARGEVLGLESTGADELDERRDTSALGDQRLQSVVVRREREQSLRRLPLSIRIVRAAVEAATQPYNQVRHHACLGKSNLVGSGVLGEEAHRGEHAHGAA